MTLLDYQLPSTQRKSPAFLYGALLLAGIPLFVGVGGTILRYFGASLEVLVFCGFMLLFSFASVPIAFIFAIVHAVRCSSLKKPGRPRQISLLSFALPVSVWPAAYVCIRVLKAAGLMP